MTLEKHSTSSRHAMLRMALLILVFLAVTACAVSELRSPSADDSPHYPSPHSMGPNATLQLKRAQLNTSNVKFRSHTGNGPFDNYLAVTLNLRPIAQLRQQLEHEIGQKLVHRGEAHITVITPPEYTALADYISIDLLNQRYGEFIQNTRFQPVCIGKSSLIKNGKRLVTWYMVIESEDLSALRTEIEHLYFERGGPPPAFASPYHPHITIGFSERDLHQQDGAVKDDSSCVYGLTQS